jgi:hypothetical protein
MSGLQEQRRNVAGVEGLWRETPDGQGQQSVRQPGGDSDEGRRLALAELERRVPGRATDEPSVPEEEATHKGLGPWKRVLWLTAGTVAWVPMALALRDSLGGQTTLMEYVLLALIWGTVIGLTREG